MFIDNLKTSPYSKKNHSYLCITQEKFYTNAQRHFFHGFRLGENMLDPPPPSNPRQACTLKEAYTLPPTPSILQDVKIWVQIYQVFKNIFIYVNPPPLLHSLYITQRIISIFVQGEGEIGGATIVKGADTKEIYSLSLSLFRNKQKA